MSLQQLFLPLWSNSSVFLGNAFKSSIIMLMDFQEQFFFLLCKYQWIQRIRRKTFLNMFLSFPLKAWFCRQTWHTVCCLSIQLNFFFQNGSMQRFFFLPSKDISHRVKNWFEGWINNGRKNEEEESWQIQLKKNQVFSKTYLETARLASNPSFRPLLALQGQLWNLQGCWYTIVYIPAC